MRYGVIRLRSAEGLPPESAHLTWIVSVWLDENLLAILALDALQTRKYLQRKTEFFNRIGRSFS